MKLTEKNIDMVVQVIKDNIGVEFDSETKLSYAFQTVIEWIEEENNNADRQTN
tara:strand:- start:972 stop:1130 length:159 start_codon:yes stop_codon:yes gene_type:complete